MLFLCIWRWPISSSEVTGKVTFQWRSFWIYLSLPLVEAKEDVPIPSYIYIPSYKVTRQTFSPYVRPTPYYIVNIIKGNCQNALDLPAGWGGVHYKYLVLKNIYVYFYMMKYLLQKHCNTTWSCRHKALLSSSGTDSIEKDFRLACRANPSRQRIWGGGSGATSSKLPKKFIIKKWTTPSLGRKKVSMKKTNLSGFHLVVRSKVQKCRGWTFSQNFSSLDLLVCDLGCFED